MKKRILSLIVTLCMLISLFNAFSITVSAETNSSRNITGRIDMIFIYSCYEIDVETSYGDEKIYYTDKFKEEVSTWEIGKNVTLEVNEDNYLVEIISYDGYYSDEGKQTSLFTDIAGTEYYADAVNTLFSRGIISGYSDGSFKPKGTITRAEFAAIICRMIGKEDDANNSKGKTSFDDVIRNHWASGYINVASKEGIINGDGKGNFRPEDKVKYEEAIKMVVCALRLDNDFTSYPDGYIAIAKNIGITEHLKGQKGKASTRGDIAVMVNCGLQVTGNGRDVENLEKDGFEVSSWSNKGVAYKDYSTTYNSDYSYCLKAEEPDDLRLVKKFNVKRNTWYCISAYFKTENVKNFENNKIGANISSGDWENSPITLLGDNEWTKINLTINSKDQDIIKASFNLGYWSNTCSGTLYIDGIECNELKPDNESNWNFLFVILKETDIKHTTPSGAQIKNSNIMSPAEISILKEAANICEVDFNKYSNGLINSSVDIAVIDEPLTNVDDYGDNEIFLSSEKAYDFLKNKVDVDKYDHITVFANLNMPTSYFGLGGMIFEQSTGYSFINTQSKNYSLWVFDKNEQWVSGCMLHEFLHFIETWSLKLNEPLSLALHDAEKLGYTNKDEWKSWYRDFMTKKVVCSDGSYTGVSPTVWKYPPRLFR